METRFSVIIPSYNRATSLGRAIQSVLNQTLSDVEIIVVDDGSIDQTHQVVEAFHQVTYFYQENKGVSVARNQGAEIAKGDWLIFLDSDDELMSNALADFSNAIMENFSASIFIGGYFLNKDGSEFQVIPEEGKFIGPLSGSFVIRRQVFREVGGFDVNLKFAENTELFLRLDQLALEKVKVPIPVLKYYQDSSGGNNNLVAMTNSIQYILEKHINLDKNVRHLYHQILGVNYIRFRQFSEARTHLWKAFLFKPFKLATLGRLGITLFPMIAKRIYYSVPLQR